MKPNRRPAARTGSANLDNRLSQQLVETFAVAFERALSQLQREIAALNATLARLAPRLQEPPPGYVAPAAAAAGGALLPTPAPAAKRIEIPHAPSGPAGATCLVPDCPAPVLAKQLCETHYRIMRRTVAAGLTFDPASHRPARTREATKTCMEEGCTEPHYAKGLCRRHYMTARSRIRAASRHDAPAPGVATLPEPHEEHEDEHEIEIEDQTPAPPFIIHGNGGRDPVLSVPLFSETPTGTTANETLPTAEMVARVVAQYRGGLDRVAEVLGRNKRTLMDLLHRLDLLEHVTRIRDTERQRIQSAPLRDRLDDLLFREKLLDDLGCLKDVDRMTQLEVKMRCQELARNAETIEDVLHQLARDLDLDEAGMKRLIWRYDLRRHLRGLKLKSSQPPMRTRA